MDLTNLSDDQIVKNIVELGNSERVRLIRVIHHLREAESRRLASYIKCKSMAEFVMSLMKCGRDQADRRIYAMRILRDVPEVENHVARGDLHLSHLTMAYSFFAREKKAGRPATKAQKKELLESLVGLSKRETEKLISSRSPEVHIPDHIRAVSAEEILVQFKAAQHLEAKLERLRGLKAHTHPHIGLGELVDQLADLGLKVWDKSVQPEKYAPARKSKSSRPHERAQKSERNQTESTPIEPNSWAAIVRAVWRRDRVCQHCGSDYALQVDHIIPRAFGGENTLENARLLCRPCNQWAAMVALGRKKMRPYLDH